MCCVTLHRWQGVHAPAHAGQSFLTPGHTNRWDTNLTVALAPGWLRTCRVSNTWHLKGVVMNGGGCGEDVSQ